MYIELTPEQRHLQAEFRQYFQNLISPEESAEMEVDRQSLLLVEPLLQQDLVAAVVRPMA